MAIKIIGVKCQKCKGIALYIFDPENIEKYEELDFNDSSIGNCVICLEDEVERLSEEEIKEIVKKIADSN